MLVTCLIMSAILLGITNACAARSWRAGLWTAAAVAGLAAMSGLFCLQWPALALNSINPAPPPPAAREAMPAAPTDKPAVD